MRKAVGGVFLALGAALLPAAPAWACGGLFCQSVPVDQNGERILFATDGDSVTAYVQIQYQGEAKDFSWIVPVPTKPKVSVGADALFTSLRGLTRPSFTLNRVVEGQCGGRIGLPIPAPVAARAASKEGLVANNAGGVTVLAQDTVGPYNAVTLEASDTATLRTWLDDNGYTIPPRLDPLLDPYVAGKYLFVAVKLQKTASVGELRPLVLKYAATKPGVPIRLTGVAATEDMDVYVWVLGKGRALPENYRHAVINEARIDWLNQGSNYRSVVTEAMNEAGGQAFVTDFAGSPKDVNLGAFDASRFEGLEVLDSVTTAAQALAALEAHPTWFLLPNNPGFGPGFSNGVNSAGLSAMQRISEAPEVQALRASAFGGLNEGNPRALEGVPFSGPRLKQLIEEQEVQPAADLRRLFGELPTLTALYTTMSPAEMTQDPMFVFNPSLPKVRADHQATGVVRCSASVTEDDAPMTVQLASGIAFDLAPNGGPQSSGSARPFTMNAALRIEQLKSSGGPSVIQDNRRAIESTLARQGLNGGGAGLSFNGGAPSAVAGGGSTRASGGFGCTGCSNPQGVAFEEGADEGATFALLIFGALGYRRWAFRKPR